MTVVSDTVNTTKRVEGLSKRLHVPIVATEDVMSAVRDAGHYEAEPLGRHKVRGKREPLAVFAIAPAPDVRVTTLRATAKTPAEIPS